MTTPRTLARAARDAAQPAGLVRSWVSFWFTPTDPVGLHRLPAVRLDGPLPALSS